MKEVGNLELLSIVVPCFNEQEVLHLFYKEIVNLADSMEELEFEFVFVNDGSKDHTLNIMKELRQKDARIHYISFSRNFGKEAAIYAGLMKSKGDYVVLTRIRPR